MNYKYKIGLDEYILTSDEHKQVVEIIHANKGKGLAILRGGDLMFKVENIRLVSKTDDPLDNQALKALPEPKETSEQRKFRIGKIESIGEMIKKRNWYQNGIK